MDGQEVSLMAMAVDTFGEQGSIIGMIQVVGVGDIICVKRLCAQQFTTQAMVALHYRTCLLHKVD